MQAIVWCPRGAATHAVFQVSCVARTAGIVLNVGCKEDPPGLRRHFGERVVNCDLNLYDAIQCRPNAVDVQFDCREPWPFPDDYAELVVLGEIIEHLTPEGIMTALREARRVGQKLCITTPRDDREQRALYPLEIVAQGLTHITVIEEQWLQEALQASGWRPVVFERTVYDFGPEGRCDGYATLCRRA